MRRKILFLFVLPILSSVRSRADYNPIDVVKGGRIEGIVHFPGETPPPAMFANRFDHDCPHGIAQNHLLVTQSNLGLRNAIVTVEIHQGRRAPPARMTLSADHCMLVPRVQAVQSGTNLQVINRDEARHEIQGFLNGASELTVMLHPQDASARRPLVRPGLYRFNCNRHLWERAWIFVAEHPYTAVTDASGHFTIDDLPPGRYDVRAWHEGWKESTKDPAGRIEYQPVEQTLQVRVKPGATQIVSFDGLQAGVDAR